MTGQEINALFNNRTDLIAGQELRVNDVWSVQVTPNDGSADGGMLQSNNVTILDKTPPFFVNISNPVNSSNFSAGMQAFNATVLDTESDISRVLFMFNTNATPFNATPTNRSGNWGVLVNLTVFPEGLHSAIVFANDTVDNINNTINISFTVDRTKPSVTFILPASGASVSGIQNIQARVIDNATAVNSVLFQFTNGTNPFNRTASNTSGTWNLSIDTTLLPEGAQTITAYADDFAGNVNDTESLGITISNVVVTVPGGGGAPPGGGGAPPKEVPPAKPVCGNGVLENGEQCDSGEGCAGNCRCDAGYQTIRSVDCELLPHCGDGIAGEDEVCDGTDLKEQSCAKLSM